MKRSNEFAAVKDITITWVLIILFLIVGIGITSCLGKKKEETKSIAQIQQEQGIPVRVKKMIKGTLQAIEQKGGTVEGIFQTVLKNSLPGTIQSIKVNVGSRVKKNALLAKIAPDGGSPYVAAKTALNYAENAYNRAQSLYKEGAVSLEALEGAKTQYENAKRGLYQARDAVNIVAPFSGTVLEVYETINKKIESGNKLIKLAQLDQVRIELEINESLINRFSKGQRAFILMDNDTIWGEVTKVAIGASEKSHSFPITTLFDNKEKRVKPGMYVTVYIITNERDDVLSLLIETILMENEKSSVYVVKDDKAYKTEIELGMRGGSRYEIVGGLNEGDLVIVSGASLLSDGSKVKIIE